VTRIRIQIVYYHRNLYEETTYNNIFGYHIRLSHRD